LLNNPYPIFGVITDYGGNPIVGAVIEVEDLTTFVVTGTATTVAEGFYQIDIQNIADSDGDTIQVSCDHTTGGAIQSGSDTFALSVISGFKELNLQLDLDEFIFTETISADDGSVQPRMVYDVPMIGYAVYVETNSFERVYNVFSVSFEDPKIVMTDTPTFEVETDNVTGRNINKYSVGKQCRIFRDGTLEFLGIIEPRNFEKGKSGSTMSFGGTHIGYKKLQDRVCDYYRASNNEYAPVVNPWRFGRKTSDDDNTLIDGMRPDEIMKCLIGTKFIWQEWFTNHDYLR